ncbi:MAG: hypothetical protein WC483_00090 [Candidatus Paceibacterota bacterium]
MGKDSPAHAVASDPYLFSMIASFLVKRKKKAHLILSQLETFLSAIFSFDIRSMELSASGLLSIGYRPRRIHCAGVLVKKKQVYTFDDIYRVTLERERVAIGGLMEWIDVIDKLRGYDHLAARLTAEGKIECLCMTSTFDGYYHLVSFDPETKAWSDPRRIGWDLEPYRNSDFIMNSRWIVYRQDRRRIAYRRRGLNACMGQEATVSLGAYPDDRLIIGDVLWMVYRREICIVLQSYSMTQRCSLNADGYLEFKIPRTARILAVASVRIFIVFFFLNSPPFVFDTEEGVGMFQGEKTVAQLLRTDVRNTTEWRVAVE